MRFLSFMVVLLIAGCASGQPTPTPATFNPLPVNSTSFFTTNNTFLLNEAPDRDAAGFNDYAFQYCTHSTETGYVGSFAGTCKAFIDGYLIVDPTSSIDYSTLGASANDFCWVALTVDTTSAFTGYTRLTGTHYIAKCSASSSTRPAVPAHAMFVMGIKIVSGSITVVQVAANQWPSVQTYNNPSEISEARPGQFFQESEVEEENGIANGLMCYSTLNSGCLGLATGDGSGCATCGSPGFQIFGSVLPVTSGGTGFDFSGSTGVLYIGPTPGAFHVEDHVTAKQGGTGQDFSGCTGFVYFTAGVASCLNIPTITPLPTSTATRTPTVTPT